MSAVLLYASQHCTVMADGPSRLKGSSTAGEALTERPTVVHPPRSYFRAPPRMAQMLVLQKLAEETMGPDYLRSLLNSVLDAPNALAAASTVLGSSPRPAEVLAPAGDGLNAYRIVRTVAEAERIFGRHTEPIFRVEQITESTRLQRHYLWRANALIETTI